MLQNKLIIMGLIVLSTACSNNYSARATPAPNYNPPDAVPKVEAKSRTGNPKSYVVFGKRYYVKNSAKGYKETGIASWYGKKFHGRRTSSGETYDMYKMTAAHKSLPIPAYVKVTRVSTGKSIIVRVNDRGPFVGSRIIDLSYAAARKLGMDKAGTSKVIVKWVDPVAWSREKWKKPVHSASAESQQTQKNSHGLTDDEVIAAIGPGPEDEFINKGIETNPEITAKNVQVRNENGTVQASSAVIVEQNQALQRDQNSAISSNVESSSEEISVATISAEKSSNVVDKNRATNQDHFEPKNVSKTSSLYLQAGAFSQRTNAERFLANINNILDVQAETLAQAESVQISEQVDASKTWYKVRIGPIADITRADIIADKLASNGFGTSIIHYEHH